MKKAIKIISVILLSICILITLYNTVIGIIFAMPSEMKKEKVCFLAPGLTWNSTMHDVKSCFGEPVEKDDYNDITGTVSNTYKSEYNGRSMSVYATRSAFLITMPFNKLRVFRYRFIIECYNGEDAEKVFDEICDKLVSSETSNTRFLCEVYSDEEFSAKIDYGPTNIFYDAHLNGANEVTLDAYAHY